jgi:radical SAM superfamily enzyme YgiQ (UPF0313 family)
MPITLVRPNGKSKQYGKLQELSAIEPPLWMALLANYYKADKIIDMEVSDDLPTGDVYIVATGNHPSAYVQQRQAAIELRDKLGYGTIIDKLPVNPIELGKPRWDLFDLTKYRAHNWHSWGTRRSPYATSFSSISCPYSCKFCVIKDFYSTGYRCRNVDEVIDEITGFRKQNIRNIKMLDEIFLLKSKHCNDILDGLRGLDLNIWGYARIDSVNEDLLNKARNAGVRWICYGIESASKELRESWDKGDFTNSQIEDVVNMTKDCGISVLGNFMFGFPGETQDQMKETFDFATKLNSEYSNFYCYVDYKDSNVSQYSKDFNSPVRDFRDKAFMDYFTNPSYLKMIQSKFGIDVVEEIKMMTSIKLERN